MIVAVLKNGCCCYEISARHVAYLSNTCKARSPQKFEKWGNPGCHFESEKKPVHYFECGNVCLLAKGCHEGKQGNILQSRF